MSRSILSRALKLTAAVAAGLALQPAAAQTSISNTGSGSAVVVPYYTVNDGWRSLLTITNTTGDSLIVKVRYHESRNSRDVLDFNIGLSPRDVWTGFLAEESVNGGRTAVLRTTDNSCVSPLALHPTLGVGNLPASIIGYSDFGAGANQTFRDHDGTNGDRSRALEGYIVIMVMGWDQGAADGSAADSVNNSSVGLVNTPPVVANGRVTYGNTAAKAKHINGVPRDCTGWDLDNRSTAGATALQGQPVNLVRGTTAVAIPGAFGSGSPCAREGTVHSSCTDTSAANPVDALAGDGGYVALTAAQGNAIKVQATLRKGNQGYAAATEPLHIQGWGVMQNLVTSQQFPYFFEPTLASTNGLWTTTGLAQLETNIASGSVFNDWVNNPTGDPQARSEWVLTFPTKAFHVDEDYDNIQAACNRYRNTQVAPADGGLDHGDTNPVAGLNEVTNGGNFTTFSTTVHSLVPRSVIINPAAPAKSAPAAQIGDNTTTCALAPFFATFQAGNTGRSNIQYTLTVYDREERAAALATGGTNQSPNPPAEVTAASLFYEANVLRIGRNAANVASVLNSPLTAIGDAATLQGTNNFGWASVAFQNALPVTGFMMRVRQFAGASVGQNDADAVPNGRTPAP